MVYLLIYFPCSLSFLFHDQADNDPNLHGKKKARKTTQAGGSGLDLAKIAAEQQAKLQKEKQEMISAINTAMPERETAASGHSSISVSASGSGTGSVSEGGSAFGSGLGPGASSDTGETGKDGQLLNISSHRNNK